MSFFATPEARPRRFGIWTYIVLAAALPLVFFALLPLFSPAQGATLRQQLALKQAALNAAYAEMDALQEELDELAEKHTAAEIRLDVIASEINDAENEIALSQKDLRIVQAQMEDRLVSLYKDGSSPSSSVYLEIIFAEADIVSVVERLSMVSRTADQDQKLFDQVEIYLGKSKEDQARLEDKKQAQQAQLQELAGLQEETSAKIGESSAKYLRIKKQVAALKEEIRKADAAAAAAAEAARLAALAAKTRNSNGGVGVPWSFVFPVDGPCSFIDTWGAWRSGGRTHKGTDVMARRGTRLVACVSGTVSSVSFRDVGLGGISLHIQGTHSDNYYYAHLDSVASGIQRGTTVKAGQLVGFVGDTGNAKGGAYHLHFGMTIGGKSVNPYVTLKSAWGR